MHPFTSVAMRRANQMFSLLSGVAVAGLLLVIVIVVAGPIIAATSGSLYDSLYPFVRAYAPVVAKVMFVAEVLAVITFMASAMCWRSEVFRGARWILPLARVLFVGATTVFLKVVFIVIPVPNI